MFTHEYFEDHEKVFIFNDLGGRLRGMIALHSTELGPALGGCRMWDYSSPNEALSDALRLSEGMTNKNACANLPLGGGKAVIMANNFDGTDRKELFECFGLHINELAGQYYTAIDVGTNLEDMKSVRRTTPYVCGVKKPIDGTTARGAFNAIMGVSEFYGWDITTKSVAIQGVGKTGYGLAKLLHEAGIGTIYVHDINQEAIDNATLEFGAVASENILTQECDILAPCALGGAIQNHVVSALNCQVVCGIANNQLGENIYTAYLLKKQGILYVPDFIANAGGVIAAAEDVTGEDHTIEIDNIKDRVVSIIGEAEVLNKTTLEVALDMAKQKIRTV
jgi:leucine dehydrogenase